VYVWTFTYILNSIWMGIFLDNNILNIRKLNKSIISPLLKFEGKARNRSEAILIELQTLKPGLIK